MYAGNVTLKQGSQFNLNRAVGTNDKTTTDSEHSGERSGIKFGSKRVRHDKGISKLDNKINHAGQYKHFRNDPALQQTVIKETELCQKFLPSTSHLPFSSLQSYEQQVKQVKGGSLVAPVEIQPKKQYLSLVAELIDNQLPGADIPQGDIDNMALGLEFAGVTAEEIENRNYQIIKPGPVIYTWTALYGTTIFNGHDLGEPDQISRHFNYVDRIKDQAGKLKKQGVPVLVIYSESNMDDGQIKIMESIFNDSDNIVVLNIERELNHLGEFKKILIEPNHYHRKDSNPAKFCEHILDRIRIAALIEGKNTLSAALEKAKKTDKKQVEEKLKLEDFTSLMYTDTDNSWFDRVPYMVAPDGMYSFPSMSFDFTLSNFSRYCEEHSVPDDLKEKITRHQKYLSNYPVMRPMAEMSQEQQEIIQKIKKHDKYQWNHEDAQTSFSFMFSEFQENFTTVIDQWKKQGLPSLLKKEFDNIDPIIWSGDNGLISVNLAEKCKFTNKFIGYPPVVDFFEGEDTPHRLAAIQCWRYFYGGHDESWQLTKLLGRPLVYPNW
ncbi:hypothetical protein [Endozoicomonas sp.]|uniref:hypothetical protein n=1 Tax=Endozoicomonas sp. TaxID=1892382 RepID=UPI002888C745|nr:hypothetical protein [Endozoicomonas sp.]